MKTWTEDDIVGLLDKQGPAADQFVGRCLLQIYSRQTYDERSSDVTKHQNGRGFSAFDAEFGSSMARFFQRNGYLSAKQLGCARKMLKRYRKQLVEVANCRMGELANECA